MSIKKVTFSIYAIGSLIWLFAWWAGNGFIQIRHNVLMLIPLLSAFIILLINMFLLIRIESINDDDEDYTKELNKMQLIENSAANMVTAITGVLIISAAISVMKDDTPIPTLVILFESAAFICAVVGVLPKYWVPSPKATWLFLLRHFKTVIHTYSISLFLGGLLALLDWL